MRISSCRNKWQSRGRTRVSRVPSVFKPSSEHLWSFFRWHNGDSRRWWIIIAASSIRSRELSVVWSVRSVHLFFVIFSTDKRRSTQRRDCKFIECVSLTSESEQVPWKGKTTDLFFDVMRSSDRREELHQVLWWVWVWLFFFRSKSNMAHLVLYCYSYFL